MAHRSDVIYNISWVVSPFNSPRNVGGGGIYSSTMFGDDERVGMMVY